MLIELEIIIVLTVMVYGGNFLLYKNLKNKKQIQGIEKLAIIFGVNMLFLLFTGGIIVLSLLNK